MRKNMNIYQKIDSYKSSIDKIDPFQGTLLNEIKNYYRIGLTWSSNAIEGNTLTESETKVLLEDGLTIGGKPLRDTFEALGHAEAYDFMFILIKHHTITEDNVIKMHTLFYKKLDSSTAGKYRTMPVIITGSKYAVCKTEQIQTEMDQLFKWICTERNKYHPAEFAALLHERFVFIHPFIDGNGRIARLLMSTSLLQDGYMLAIIPPVLRHEYIELLEKAHENDKPFVHFIAERIVESQKEIMRLLDIPVPDIPLQ
jgi:Fic family protein